MEKKELKNMANKYNSGEYYIHRNSGNKVFVKEANFFVEQGGLKEEWGKNWKKISADSIEHARLIGETTLPKHETNYYWRYDESK